MARLSEPRGFVALALVALGAVGVLRGLALLGVAGPVPLATELAIALLALLAGVGLWRRSAWAPAAIVALGIGFAVTRLVDAFVLGIRPWLFALLTAAAALLLAVLLAAWARHDAPALDAPGRRDATRRPAPRL